MVARVTDGWLPLTPEQLALLGWPEGQAVEVEVVDGVLVATPTDAPNPVRDPPKKNRHL